MNNNKVMFKKKKALNCWARNSPTLQQCCTVARPVKREEWHDLLQIRAPHRLIKVEQPGLIGAAVPRET